MTRYKDTPVVENVKECGTVYKKVCEEAPSSGYGAPPVCSTQPVEECGTVARHDSDFRDSHEYLQKQVWGAQNCTRLSSRRFGLERTKLTEASVAVCFDSAHPTYFETICVH